MTIVPVIDVEQDGIDVAWLIYRDTKVQEDEAIITLLPYRQNLIDESKID